MLINLANFSTETTSNVIKAIIYLFKALIYLFKALINSGKTLINMGGKFLNLLAYIGNARSDCMDRFKDFFVAVVVGHSQNNIA